MAWSNETGHGRGTRITKATKITKTKLGFVIFVFFVVFVPQPSAVSPQDVDWATHSGEGNIRYSPLAQINKSNVAGLKAAASS